MTPYIPPEPVSLFAILGAVLCVFTLRKLPIMLRSSVIAMFRVGMVILIPALVTFSVLYIYIATSDVEVVTRQFFVRLLLIYLFSAIDIWQVILLKWGKTL